MTDFFLTPPPLGEPLYITGEEDPRAWNVWVEKVRKALEVNNGHIENVQNLLELNTAFAESVADETTVLSDMLTAVADQITADDALTTMTLSYKGIKNFTLSSSELSPGAVYTDSDTSVSLGSGSYVVLSASDDAGIRIHTYVTYVQSTHTLYLNDVNPLWSGTSSGQYNSRNVLLMIYKL